MFKFLKKKISSDNQILSDECIYENAKKNLLVICPYITRRPAPTMTIHWSNGKYGNCIHISPIENQWSIISTISEKGEDAYKTKLNNDQVIAWILDALQNNCIIGCNYQFESGNDISIQKKDVYFDS